MNNGYFWKFFSTKKICFVHLLESPQQDDSNKYTKCVFLKNNIGISMKKYTIRWFLHRPFWRYKEFCCYNVCHYKEGSLYLFTARAYLCLSQFCSYLAMMVAAISTACRAFIDHCHTSDISNCETFKCIHSSEGYIEGSVRKGCNYILWKCSGETKNLIIFSESNFFQCKQDILSKITIKSFVIYNFVHVWIWKKDICD